LLPGGKLTQALKPKANTIASAERTQFTFNIDSPI
jgi:hypothetical protein